MKCHRKKTDQGVLVIEGGEFVLSKENFNLFNQVGSCLLFCSPPPAPVCVNLYWLQSGRTQENSSKLGTLYCVLCTVYYVLCNMYCKMCTVKYALCTVSCVLCTVHYAQNILHSTTTMGHYLEKPRG